jgi:hypothetical protein
MNPKPEHEHLSAWLDGELSDSEAAELEAELARDPALRAELDALEAVVSFVRQEGPSQAPMGLHHRVMARIDEEFPERSSTWSWLRRPWGIPLEGWVLAAAAAAVLLLLVPDWGGEPSSELTGEEKELSPAALELPKPITEKDAPVVVLEKPPAPGPVTVIGRASTEKGKPVAKGTGATKLAAEPVPEGTAEEPVVVPVPSPTLELPAASGTAEIPAAPEAAVRYVITSDDPKMKREVLSVAAQYGGARSLQNAQVDSALMGAGVEELLVSVRQTDLPEFYNKLKKLGYDVHLESEDKMVPGGKIDVRLTLSLVQPEEAMHPSRAEAAELPSME